MVLIPSDIMRDALGLSPGLSAIGFAVGLLLWLTGWRGHRFWIVLAATVGAGVFGLLKGPIHQIQPLVAGVLLAIAAGLLALALVRVLAFAAGGAAAWLALHSLIPAPWNEPLICFLAGGLVGLLLFRLWTMILTSFGGSLLMVFSGLCLGDRLGKLDAVGWTDNQGALLTWMCVGLGLLGVIMQFLLERGRIQRERRLEVLNYSLSKRRRGFFGSPRLWNGDAWYHRRAS
jgi:hypothetical protein